MRALVVLLAACGAHPVPASKCTDRTFDFLVGDFRSTERDATGKVGSTGTIHNDVVLNGCAIREQWKIDGLFDAQLLRSFDTGTKRWYVSYVDDGGHHQLYEGRVDGTTWRFFRERLADDGSRVLIRITWIPSATGYTQTIERSTDGASWVTGGVIDYRAI